MKTMVFILLLFLLLYQVHNLYKKVKAYKQLDDIYSRRKEREDRKMRLIAEKPDNVIFASDLNKDTPLMFVGSFKSLNGVKGKNGDLANVDGIEYFYKDGKWYELVDDVSHLNRLRY